MAIIARKQFRFICSTPSTSGYKQHRLYGSFHVELHGLLGERTRIPQAEAVLIIFSAGSVMDSGIFKNGSNYRFGNKISPVMGLPHCQVCGFIARGLNSLLQFGKLHYPLAFIGFENTPQVTSSQYGCTVCCPTFSNALGYYIVVLADTVLSCCTVFDADDICFSNRTPPL